jgi:hypothetical protein
MGEFAWRALGEVAQLPAWNRALRRLGNRYVAVQNRRIEEQARTQLVAMTPFLRAFSRHVAVKNGDAELFHRLEGVSGKLGVPDDWAEKWWEVPLDALLELLISGFREIPGVAPHTSMLGGIRNMDDLRNTFLVSGVTVDPNPYETASHNQTALESLLARMHDLHQAWCEMHDVDRLSANIPIMSVVVGCERIPCTMESGGAYGASPAHFLVI